MSTKPPRQSPPVNVCPSCGREWREHLGLLGMCRRLTHLLDLLRRVLASGLDDELRSEIEREVKRCEQ